MEPYALEFVFSTPADVGVKTQAMLCSGRLSVAVWAGVPAHLCSKKILKCVNCLHIPNSIKFLVQVPTKWVHLGQKQMCLLFRGTRIMAVSACPHGDWWLSEVLLLISEYLRLSKLTYNNLRFGVILKDSKLEVLLNNIGKIFHTQMEISQGYSCCPPAIFCDSLKSIKSTNAQHIYQ